MRQSKIEWCDLATNPVRFKLPDSAKPINLCVKTSIGCKNCYSESTTSGFRSSVRKLGGFSSRAMKAACITVVDNELSSIMKFSSKTGKDAYKPPYVSGGDRPIIYVGDMTDMFGPWMVRSVFNTVFRAIECRQDAIFVMVTKRPKLILRYWPFNWINGQRIPVYLENAIIGTSISNQREANENIPLLLEAKECCRSLLVNAEPLLSPISLSGISDIDWLIVSGETGTKSRPCGIHWIKSLAEQAAKQELPLFISRLGSRSFDKELPKGEQSIHAGSDGQVTDDWPQHLLIREFPKWIAS